MGAPAAVASGFVVELGRVVPAREDQDDEPVPTAPAAASPARRKSKKLYGSDGAWYSDAHPRLKIVGVAP